MKLTQLEEITQLLCRGLLYLADRDYWLAGECFGTAGDYIDEMLRGTPPGDLAPVQSIRESTKLPLQVMLSLIDAGKSIREGETTEAEGLLTGKSSLLWAAEAYLERKIMGSQIDRALLRSPSVN